MASPTPSDKQEVWRFFLWWYRENFLVSRHESVLFHRLKPKENALVRSRFMEAFLLNGLVHTGLMMVCWTMMVSKKYSYQFLHVIPYPVRLGATLTMPPLLVYLRFQDIFYEKELVALAHRWASSQSH